MTLEVYFTIIIFLHVYSTGHCKLTDITLTNYFFSWNFSL